MLHMALIYITIRHAAIGCRHLLRRTDCVQSCLQHGLEEIVIPIDRRLFVQRNDKKIVRHYLVQQRCNRCARRKIQHRSAQFWRQHRQDRRSQQKGFHSRALVGQHFVHEIIGQILGRVASQVGQVGFDLWLAAQRERQQTQASPPAVEPLLGQFGRSGRQSNLQHSFQ